MNKKLLKYLIIAIMFITGNTFSQDIYKSIVIKDIYEDRKVLDEWKAPGKYSPVNMFDNDHTTCFAEGGYDNMADISIKFSDIIECDELQILGGCAKNEELYSKNNRPKKITIWLSASAEEFNKNRNFYKRKIVLEDKMNIQKIPFEGTQKFGYFSIQVLDTYPGTKYNDTCITEFKFFNKGIEIPIKDVAKLKKDYVKWVGERLQNFFQMEKYEVYSTGSIGKATVTKSGNISYYIYPADAASNPPLPTRFYIKDSMLYMTLNGKTGLVDYYLFHEDPIRVIVEAIGSYKYNRGASPVFEVIKEDKK